MLPNQYEDGRRPLIDVGEAERMIRERDRAICEQAAEAARLRGRLAEARAALARAAAALEKFEREPNRKGLTAALIGGIRLFLEREA